MAQDPEGTRQRIFEAAIEEFAAHGNAGARVDRIAEKARANKESIYRYFGTKDELLRRVLDRFADDRGEQLLPQSQEMDAYAAGLFRYFIAHPEFLRLSLWEGLELGAQPDQPAMEHRHRHYSEKLASSPSSSRPVRSTRSWIPATCWSSSSASPTTGMCCPSWSGSSSARSRTPRRWSGTSSSWPKPSAGSSRCRLAGTPPGPRNLVIGEHRGVRQPRIHRAARVAYLPGDDELRQRQRAGLGPGRGGGRADRPGRRRRRCDLLRHRRHVLGRGQ